MNEKKVKVVMIVTLVLYVLLFISNFALQFAEEQSTINFYNSLSDEEYNDFIDIQSKYQDSRDVQVYFGFSMIFDFFLLLSILLLSYVIFKGERKC